MGRFVGGISSIYGWETENVKGRYLPNKTLPQPLETNMPSYTHDLIVIGAGSGGLGAAGFGGALGLNVALIDKSVHLYGGDCLNFGCVPSKALLHVAAQFAGARQAAAFGLQVEGKANFAKVMEYVHGQQDIIREHESPDYLKQEYGLDCWVGEAMLTGRREVTVNGQKLTAPRIVLATGSKPRHLKCPGAELVKQYDNESVFSELAELPEELLIVGGGPNSCEMAQAFCRLGSRVTLLNRGERLLSQDPAEAAYVLEQKLTEEGVTIRHQTEVAKFKNARTAQLTTDGVGAGELTFTHLIVAIGREVRTTGLGLELAGVHTKDGKIVVDDYYRTTNPAIYTVGDAYGHEMFSHGAEKHNTNLWTNLLSPRRPQAFPQALQLGHLYRSGDRHLRLYRTAATKAGDRLRDRASVLCSRRPGGGGRLPGFGAHPLPLETQIRQREIARGLHGRARGGGNDPGASATEYTGRQLRQTHQQDIRLPRRQSHQSETGP